MSSTLLLELAAWKGDQRIALLEAIAHTGSITQAARSLHVSYKHAWDLLHELGNLAEEPLLATQSGGSRGGGSVLTSYALDLINSYRTLEAEHTARLDKVGSRWHALSWQTSARNHFLGRIQNMQSSGLETRVTLAMNDQFSLIAQITQASVERLHLDIAHEAHVMFKASALEIHVSEPKPAQASNNIRVQLMQIQQANDQSELTLYHESGIHLYAMLQPHHQVFQEIKEGQMLWAHCPAHSILLAVHHHQRLPMDENSK